MRKDSILIKPKPFTIKRYLWVLLGLVGIITGSATFYLFEYRNIHATLIIFIVLVLFGWLSILNNIFPEFFDRTNRSYKIILLKIFACIVVMGFATKNIMYVTNLEKEREKSILANEPSVITTAKVVNIEVRQLKSSTRKYIHIQYIANGDTVLQEMADDNNEFNMLKDYKLKYSVKYPEMFEIYK